MLLAVQNRLIQMCDAPALGNVEAEYLGQLGSRPAGGGVAPGTECRQLTPIAVKGEDVYKRQSLGRP